MAPRTAANRQTTIQPSYDFLAGNDRDSDRALKASTSRTNLRMSTTSVRPDIGNEELRAQIKTLQYELETYKKDQEVTRLRHEKELRDAESKAAVDAKKAQALANTGQAATSKYDTLVQELNGLKSSSANVQHDLEKKYRAAQDELRNSKEELEEAQTEFARLDRERTHKISDLERRSRTLKQSMDDLQADVNGKIHELERTKERLAEKDKDYGELETETLRLKAQVGDADQLETFKSQLSEQINYVRKLEKTNNDQLAELRQLRESHRAVGIVEEEKSVLMRRLQRMEDMERELGEAQFQRQVLEEERKSWTAHLRGDVGNDETPEFDSPEAISRALTEERLQRITLSERLGAVQPLLAEKEQLIDSLDQEKKRLKKELEQAKALPATTANSAADTRFRARLERQKNLVLKEVEYLRAQLRTFDSEDTTQDISPQATVDAQARERIVELEDLVSNYRSELDAANIELSSVHDPKPVDEDAKSAKRRLPEDDDKEQLGMLSRKNRKLQDELSAAQQRGAMLDRELEASKSQLASLQELSRVRVLSLRNNPTDEFERVKLSQIRTLRTENEGLHALLERKNIADSVPRASLTAKEQEIEEWKVKVAEREKRMLRLRQSFAARAMEMRQAIASILGWKVEFAPNGKFKLSSIFYPQGGDEDEEDESEGGLGSNYLIFDGEKGTVQISGGPESEFARDIKGLVKFWVEGRKEIPGLMAACTLEFYERTTRAMRM